jgi:hypothetical protein
VFSASPETIREEPGESDLLRIFDLAIVNGGPVGGSGKVTILLGAGNGTFAAASASPTAWGETPSSIVAADFNGDGNLDLAIANGSTNAQLQATATILLGNGDGTFAQSSGCPITALTGIASSTDNLAVGDFNGDGWSDLVGPGAVLFAVGQTSTATANSIAVPVATGTQRVSASYPGDANYQPSFSSTISLIALQGTPTVGLTASTIGASVTLTATIAGSNSA